MVDADNQITIPETLVQGTMEVENKAEEEELRLEEKSEVEEDSTMMMMDQFVANHSTLAVLQAELRED